MRWWQSLIIFLFPLIAGFNSWAISGGQPHTWVFDFTGGDANQFQSVFRDIPVEIFNEYQRRLQTGEDLGPIAPLSEPPSSYAEDASHWLLNSGIFSLPSGIEGKGFLLPGDNHSDDLDMFIVRKMGKAEGFKPNRSYKVQVTVDLAGNAPHGAIGVGGDPEVRIEAVLEQSFDPTQYIVDSLGYVRHLKDLSQFPHAEVNTNAVCNVEPKGFQECPANLEIPFELKEGSPSQILTIRTNPKGEFWLMIGGHSGYESFSGIYYKRVQLDVLSVN